MRRNLEFQVRDKTEDEALKLEVAKKEKLKYEISNVKISSGRKRS